MQKAPWAEICWYFTESREQFRLGGELVIVGEDHSDGELRKVGQAASQHLPGKCEACMLARVKDSPSCASAGTAGGLGQYVAQRPHLVCVAIVRAAQGAGRCSFQGAGESRSHNTAVVLRIKSHPQLCGHSYGCVKRPPMLNSAVRAGAGPGGACTAIICAGHHGCGHCGLPAPARSACPVHQQAGGRGQAHVVRAGAQSLEAPAGCLKVKSKSATATHTSLTKSVSQDTHSYTENQTACDVHTTHVQMVSSRLRSSSCVFPWTSWR